MNHTHDLTGLSGLEDAYLYFAGPRWQPDLLVQVPRLQRLWPDAASHLGPMSAGDFNSVPLPTLTHLTLAAEGMQALPVDWLMYPPGLTHLDLDLDLPTLRELSPGWLPPLTHLEMVWTSSGQSIQTADGRWVYETLKALPADWLAVLPALTHLWLESPHLKFLLPGGLRTVPALTDLEVVGAAIEHMPTDWLRSVGCPRYWSGPAWSYLQYSRSQPTLPLGDYCPASDCTRWARELPHCSLTVHWRSF